MEIQETCLNCYHSIPVSPTHRRAGQFLCRRFPPYSISLPSGRLESFFPRMNENDRCGEWKDKTPPTYQSTGPR
jgi:hypothetical protein